VPLVCSLRSLFENEVSDVWTIRNTTRPTAAKEK
jgi:hypothetical protein